MADDLPPPRSSPRAPGADNLGPEGDTGQFPVVKADMRKAFRINEVLTAAFVLLGALGTLWTGQYIFIGQARAAGREAADSGVAEVKAQQAAIEARLTTLEKKADRSDAKQDRQDQKIDLLLDAARVPFSRRPPPVPPLADGGR